MNDSPMTILYVADVMHSAAWYQRLLDSAPLEASPGFAMFKTAGGAMLGLWRRADVLPAARGKAGDTELCFGVADRAAVDACYAQWQGQGVELAQAPTKMDFGYTFAAQDLDGHRVRVFTPEPA